MYEHFPTLSQRQLGEIFNATSHKIGRWLVEIGLRTSTLQPTERAMEEGYSVWTQFGSKEAYGWAWNREKTIAALEATGHRRVDVTANEPPQLRGPFCHRRTPTGNFEIVDGQGTVAIWVWGEQNAKAVAWLLHVAEKHGKLPQPATL